MSTPLLARGLPVLVPLNEDINKLHEEALKLKADKNL